MSKRTLLPISAFATKIVTLDAMNTNPDLLNGDLSGATGTKTLLANDMVPDGLPASSKEKDTAIDKFRRYSIAGSAIPATGKFDPIACGVSQI
jgi:hypothetical protein